MLQSKVQGKKEQLKKVYVNLEQFFIEENKKKGKIVALFSGLGFDSHRIIDNCKIYTENMNIPDSIDMISGLMIGGICVDKDKRFMANSDGDILIHSIIDSLAPTILKKDIGELFPDSTNMYKNYPSEKLLKHMIEKIEGENVKYRIHSLDCVIVIDSVKITNFKDQIIQNLQRFFPQTSIALKGKRTEGSLLSDFGYCWVVSLIEYLK